MEVLNVMVAVTVKMAPMRLIVHLGRNPLVARKTNGNVVMDNVLASSGIVMDDQIALTIRTKEIAVS